MTRLIKIAAQITPFVFVLGMLMAAGSFADIQWGDPVFKPVSRVDYLVIIPADSGFYAPALRLAELKKDRGLRTNIETVDAIVSAWPGADTPAMIRSCIRSYYADSGLSWLLLLGDFSRVPSRIVAVSDSTPGALSDIYYQCLDTTWDLDGDGIYGEEPSLIKYRVLCRYDSTGSYVCDRLIPEKTGLDLWPDVYMGRLPASSPLEASIMVDKIVAYSTDYRQSATAKKRVLFGPQLFGTVVSANGSVVDDAANYMHYGIKPLFIGPLSVFAAGSVVELYEDRIGPGDTLKNDSIEISRASLSALLSEGSNLLVFCAHGCPAGIRICSFAEPPLFSTADVMALSSPTFSHVMGFSCSLMEMPAESTMCFAKAFLVNPAGGAVAFYGNNNIDHLDPSWPLARSAFAQVCRGGNTRLAPALQIENVNEERINLFTHAYWGDPEVELWTKPLAAMDSITLTVGRDGDRFYVHTMPEIDSILVAIRESGGRLFRSWTMAGIALLDTIIPVGDSLRITGTKHDYLPARISIRASDIPLSLDWSAKKMFGKADTKFVSVINGCQVVIGQTAGAILRIYTTTGKICYKGVSGRPTVIRLVPGVYLAEVRLPSGLRVEKFSLFR